MQVAPNQLSPGEPFDVFYYLRNPFDGATYYVRAKIYDVRTGELLSTVALDQSPTNAHLFIKTVQSPPDPSGYGRNIVAIASVYLDSGFTEQSDSYEEQEQYYLIKSVAPMLGGGAGIDMRAVREMMEEVVSKKLAGLPKPAKPQAFPTEALFGAIGALQREVNRVPKEIDLSGVSKRLSALQQAISAIPQPKEADLAPVLDAIAALPGQIERAIASAKADVQQTGNAVAREIRTSLMAMEKEIVGKAGKGLDDLIGRQTLTVPMSAVTSRKEPQPIDVGHLMN